MKRFYIIAHTHWDREWYKTYQENRVRLIQFMDDLLETMENDERFNCFMLDGQTSLILDYLEIKPQNKHRLMNLIQSKRIIIGPWFVQPDVNIPSGESLIRNLLLSKNISDEFGPSMKVGYLPDSFGQSAIIPMILKGFDINSAVFYRGLTDEDTPYNEFIWSSLDDSQVVAVWLPVGYGNGMFLSEDLNKSIEVIESNLKLLEERSISGDILLMVGSDQCFVKKFLPDICEKLNNYYRNIGKDYEFIIASLEEYIDQLQIHRDKMKNIKGEFRKGKHSRTHISIGATRLDIKRKNFEIERKYQCLLEPLISITSMYDRQYEKELVNRGWRYIIENHAHDSICNCCTDTVHREMIMRMEYADQIANTIINEKLEKLHSLIKYDPGKGRPIVVFSSFLGRRKDFVNVDVYVKDLNFSIIDNQGNEIEYIINDISTINLKDTKVSFSPLPDDFYKKVNISFYAEIDGVGYRTYYIKEGRPKAISSDETLVHENVLENEYIKAEVWEDGSIYITDKVNGLVYKDISLFRESGNAGDEYDYSPPYNDIVITSKNCLKSINTVLDTPLKATLRLEYILEVPKSTSNQERSKDYVTLKITTDMSIYKYGRHVEFKTKIDNTAENHRIQAVFDFGSLEYKHFADIQFGEISRENESELTLESEQKGWCERYYPIFSQQKYCGVTNKNNEGFIIMNKGLPQYEVENDGTTKICVTLLSGVGYMGNENLKYRKGRRSGALCETPEAQMLGEFEAEYSFLPIGNDFDYQGYAERYVNPIYAVCYPEYDCAGIWPDSFVIFENYDGLILSAFKCAENKEGYILRVVNPNQSRKNDIKILYNRYLFDSIEPVNLAETKIEDGNIVVEKINNPDGSNKAELSGVIKIKSMNSNAVCSFRIKKI